jgi:hypothetical protein
VEQAHELSGPKLFASGRADTFRGDSRNLGFLLLFGAFGAITVLAIVFLRDDPNVELLLSPWMLVLIALASYRLGRIIALDEVMQPFRLFFTEIREEGGEKHEVPRQKGLRGAIGALISSPDSVGFWVAGLLVYLFILAPTIVRLIVIVLAINGLAQLFNSLVHLVTVQRRARLERADVPTRVDATRPAATDP